MAVTDAYAIKFSNEVIRVGADRLAQAYYRADAAADRWGSLGGGQPAIDVMEQDIRKACNRIIELYEFCWRAEKVWFLGMNSTIPNDSGESVVDGSPADHRPAITGQSIHALMARVVELQNWLLSATQSFTDTARNNAATYNTVLSASDGGPVVLSEANAGNAINRFGELRTDYEASSNVKLGTILAVAVNPQA